MSKRNSDGSKKKMALWLKIVIGVVGVFLVLCIAVFAYVQVTLNKINKADSQNFDVVLPEEEYFETDEIDEIAEGVVELDPEDIQWDTDITILNDKDIINILLIGQDRREGETRARSDSMILATINKTKKTIQLTSFMRDMYVQIPGYSDNRINAAYAFGGMELLQETIETNFGIEIDGNIEVDFSGFITSIDTIGGIDIELNAVEADYLNTNYGWSLSSGAIHLTGEQALAYSRIRYVGNSDYERTERQRKVLTTAFNKMKNSSINTVIGLIDEIFPLLTTDLSNLDMISYATSIVSMGISDVESYRIPIDGQYTPAVISGMQVLVPDLATNRAYLQEVIYGK